MQKKVGERNRRITEMVDKACQKGKKSGSMKVKPLQALKLVDDDCERVSINL